jgi:hypothetical protein
MPLSTRFFLFAALILGIGLFTACSHKEEVEPAPAEPKTTFAFTRHFDLATQTPGGSISHTISGVTYPSQDIIGKAHILPLGYIESLVLTFKSLPDDLRLVTDRSTSNNTWVGTYALNCQTLPKAPVVAIYSYGMPGGAGVYPISSWNPVVNGTLTVTKHDIKTQLLSGHYEISVPNHPDPSQQVTTTSPLGILMFTGEFHNVKLD